MSKENPHDKEDNEPKNPGGYDDLFRGFSHELLPKTTEESPETKKVLNKLTDPDEEIKKIKEQVLTRFKEKLTSLSEKSLAESEEAIRDYYLQVKTLQHQAETLPKYKEYTKYSSSVPKSVYELEKTSKGKLMRLWRLFTFGTESDWWKMGEKYIDKLTAKAKIKKELALKEAEEFMRPQLKRLQKIKNDRLAKAYANLFSLDVPEEITKQIGKETKTQKLIRKPKNPKSN